MTHVAVLCDRPGLQKALPQFIIANQRTHPARAMPALLRRAPRNVILIRQQSAWSNAVLTARAIRTVAAAVAAALGTGTRYKILFFMDAARIHLAEAVWRACRRVDAWLSIVPPRTTLRLQPLDTHVFARYKACLVSSYQESRARSGCGEGDVEIHELLDCVYTAIREVIEGRSWTHAFEQDGLASRQLGVCASLKRHLQLAELPHVSDSCPTDEDIRVCFPRRCTVPLALVRALFLQRAACPVPTRVARARALLRRDGGLRDLSEEPRTRAEHRRATVRRVAAASAERDER